LIDPRAIVDVNAEIADDVEIGPFSIVGPEVKIGSGTVIGPHVVMKGLLPLEMTTTYTNLHQLGKTPKIKNMQMKKPVWKLVIEM